MNIVQDWALAILARGKSFIKSLEKMVTDRVVILQRCL